MSLVMIAALGASALAGMPLHSDVQECNMSGMNGDMDCCARARKQAATPEVVAARICCALNCPSSGTLPPAGSIQLVPPSSLIAEHPAAIYSLFVIPRLRLRPDSLRDYSQNTLPAYIRHLALLI